MTIVCKIAFGIFFLGSDVSPAATPINSAPEKAKLADSIAKKTEPAPFGNQPFSVRWLKSGADSFPWIGINPNMPPRPRIRKIASASTLINDIQNSLTENQRTSIMFESTIMPIKKMHQSQVGMPGNQRCDKIAKVMNCEPNATVHVSQ